MPATTIGGEPGKVETPFDHLDEDYEFHFVKKLEDDDIKLVDLDASPKKTVEEPIELFDLNESHVDKQLKLNDGKAKKIRRIELEDLTEKRRNASQQKKSFPTFRIFFILSTLSAIGFMFIGSDVRDELIQHARTEYNVLMQGKTYCTDALDYTKIVGALRENIVGQKEALDSIEAALKDEKPFKSIIFHGPTGTGKTLSSQIMQHNFRWQENTQVLLHNPDAKFDLSSITRKMSTCGFNLLIIDDLYPMNNDMLNIAKALENAAKEKNFKLILVFIFNVSKESENANFNEYKKNHNTIEFRRMNDYDLDECMGRIEKELSITLSHIQRENVKASVDINKHGCKNIRSKVSLYA